MSGGIYHIVMDSGRTRHAFAHWHAPRYFTVRFLSLSDAPVQQKYVKKNLQKQQEFLTRLKPRRQRLFRSRDNFGKVLERIGSMVNSLASPTPCNTPQARAIRTFFTEDHGGGGEDSSERKEA